MAVESEFDRIVNEQGFEREAPRAGGVLRGVGALVVLWILTFVLLAATGVLAHVVVELVTFGWDLVETTP